MEIGISYKKPWEEKIFAQVNVIPLNTDLSSCSVIGKATSTMY